MLPRALPSTADVITAGARLGRASTSWCWYHDLFASPSSSAAAAYTVTPCLQGEARGGLLEATRRKEQEIARREAELAARRKAEEEQARQIAELEGQALAQQEQWGSKQVGAGGLAG